MSEPLAPGRALRLCIAFRVSGGRNRSALWKPAIDALGPLLGTDRPTRPYRPLDGRTVDDSLGHAVELAHWWGEAAAAGGCGRAVRTSAGGGR